MSDLGDAAAPADARPAVDASSYLTLDTLGEDLILLSPRHRRGWIQTPLKIKYGLLGSELIRLVASGHVSIVAAVNIIHGAKMVPRLDVPRPKDQNLAAAFRTIATNQSPKSWIKKTDGADREQTYLRQLEAKGVLRSEVRRSLLFFRLREWYVVDEARAAAVKRRLDEIVDGERAIGIEEKSLAGLAYAVNYGNLLYSDKSNKERRKRLQGIARPPKRRRQGMKAAGIDTAVQTSAEAASATAAKAASAAAMDAAIDAAVDQAVSAAVNSAIDAAVAAVDGGGGHDGGGGGGGHHG